MDIWLLILFVATEFMFSLSPGPAVAAVVSSSIVGGYRLAFIAILGVLIGNLVYFIMSAIFISAGTNAGGDYFYYIKIAGCLYLAYIVYKEYFIFIQNKNNVAPLKKIDNSTKNGFSRFIITFVMQISNPKTILFFTAFLPQFINNEYSLTVQFFTLGFLSFMTEFVVLMIYAAGGQAMLKYGSGNIGKYANHIGNFMMAVAVIWSLFR